MAEQIMLAWFKIQQAAGSCHRTDEEPELYYMQHFYNITDSK